MHTLPLPHGRAVAAQRGWRQLGALLFGGLLVLANLSAQTATGTIRGRVLNAATRE